MLRTVVGLLLSGALDLNIAQASTYVAIGDSITSGTHANPSMQHGFHYSWATGDQIERNFAKQAGFDSAYNVSLPGALSSIVGYQVSFAEHVEADYVSLLVGTNDVCWGLGHTVTGNIHRLVERLEKNPNIKGIFLGTLPDLQQVYDVGRESPYCQVTTSVSCPNFMARDDAYRAGVMRQIKEINAELIDLEKNFAKLHVITRLDTQVYDVEDISTVDCFHPSKIGQQKIADAFFEAWLESKLD
jgi:lysophospholipase L1-like esterase